MFLLAPNPPELKLVNAHKEFIEVEWSEPSVVLGILRSYNICWYTNIKDRQCVSLLYVNHKYRIENLVPNQFYFVYAIAFTDAGNSDHSNILKVKTLGKIRKLRQAL